MIPCVIIGDSIAQGIGQVNPSCMTLAKKGASSAWIASTFRVVGGSKVTVISMGSNQPTHPNNLRSALSLREMIQSPKVVWILPYDRNAAQTVRKAARPGDVLVDLQSTPTRDGVHPSSYTNLGKFHD